VSPDVSCTVFVELVTDYLEGAVTPDERAAVDHHLALCPHCVEILEQWRAVVALAGRLSEAHVEAVAPEVRAALLDAFRAGGSPRDPASVDVLDVPPP
jgi:anti-sigma factor RsiW